MPISQQRFGFFRKSPKVCASARMLFPDILAITGELWTERNCCLTPMERFEHEMRFMPEHQVLSGRIVPAKL